MVQDLKGLHVLLPHRAGLFIQASRLLRCVSVSLTNTWSICSNRGILEGEAFRLLLVLKPLLLLKSLFLFLSFHTLLPFLSVALQLHLFPLYLGLLLFLLDLLYSLLPLETFLVRQLLLLGDCPGGPSVDMYGRLTEQGWTTW